PLGGARILRSLVTAAVYMGAALGRREIVLGMTHYGRLNVLANILSKPYQEIFAEFEANFLPGSVAGDGDVRYHLGISCDRTPLSGHQLHLSLTPNPSHLEAVDPVVEGRVRANQDLFADTERQ